VNTTPIIFEPNVEGVMRDGVVLRADVWRPDKPGRFPVLLTRTPYDKTHPRISLTASLDPRRVVPHDYVMVFQDTRGRFASDGDSSDIARSNFQDGYDSVEWAASLPYSDGNVGMFGISFMALTQWMAALSHPPHLRTIFPQQFGDDRLQYPGRSIGLAFSLSWVIAQSIDTLNKRAATGEDVTALLHDAEAALNDLRQACAAVPLRGGLPFIHKVSPIYDAWLDSYVAAKRPRDLMSRVTDVDLPVCNLGGWYDPWCRNATENFTGTRDGAEAPPTRGFQKMIVGPWGHGQFDDYQGDLSFGMSSSGIAAGIESLQIRWFDHWLKGIDNGVASEPPVRIFVMGINQWRDEHEWPLARTVWTDYYLHSGGRANTSSGDGSLDTTTPTEEPADVFLNDPRHPVPTVGASGVGILEINGPRDQARVETRSDVLAYTTNVLTEDTEVTGPITATLFAATEARDTDWIIKLVDVHPDGRAFNLTDGTVRARYRNGPEELLEPGKVYEYRFDMQVTSNVFKRGHRIRIQIAGTDFPRLHRNPNTGDPLLEDAALVPVVQTVLHDARHPSHVTLPVIPREPQ
jgi:putative CocE/NonD family hydrolase